MICIVHSVEGETFPVGRFPRPPQLQLTLTDQKELILRRKKMAIKKSKNKSKKKSPKNISGLFVAMMLSFFCRLILPS